MVYINSFPFRTFPHTTNDKWRYYGGKLMCVTMDVMGVSIYSQIMNTNHLSQNQIEMMSEKQIEESCNQTVSAIKYNTKLILLNAAISGSTFYLLYKYADVPKQYLISLECLASALMMNNVYNGLANLYHNIKLNRQLSIINHNKDICRAIKASEYQFNYLDVNLKEISNESYINNTIHSKITDKKLLWHKTLYNVECEPKMIYVVFNDFYEKLFFVFTMEKVADAFMAKVKELTIEQIDDLSKDSIKAEKFQKEFVQDFLYVSMVCHYYK